MVPQLSRDHSPARSLRAGRFLLALLLTTAGFASSARADAVEDYNTALALYKQQRWDQAEQELRKFVAANPNHERTASARLYLGQSLVHQKKFEPARDAFRTFVTSYPQHPDLYLAMYRIGECSYFLGDLKSAKTELDRFVSAFPQQELAEWALQYLGETEFRLNDPKGAAAAFQLQLDRFPQGRLAEDAKFLQAKAQLAAGDTQTGLAGLQALAANEAGSRAADAQLELAMALYDTKQYAPAREAFDQLLRKFPQSPLAPLAELNAGYSLYHLGEYDAAIGRFDKAAATPAQADEARFWKGMSQKSKRDFTAAAETLKGLAESSQDQTMAGRARFHWADSELRLGHNDAAKSQFLAIAEQAPQGPLAADSLHLATEAALAAGQLDEAQQLDERFQQAHGNSGLALVQRLLRGRISLARGDQAEDAQKTDDAKTHYTRATAEFGAVVKESQVPRTAQLGRLLLARAYDRLGNPASVLSTLEPIFPALRGGPVDPDAAEAYTLETRALLATNKPEDAIQVGREFLQKYPDHPQRADVLASLTAAESASSNPADVDASLNRLWQETDKTLAQRTTYRLADEAYNRKDWTRAAQLFQRLIDGGPGELQGPALSGLGYALHEAGRHQEAAEAFASLIRRTGGDRALLADAHQMHALSLKLSGQLEAAARAYDEALKQFAIPPGTQGLTAEEHRVAANASQLARGLARLRRELGDRDAADAAYQLAYKQLTFAPEPRQGELDKLLQEWAMLHYEARDYARSDELFRQLITARPDSPLADEAHLYLAESDFFGGRIDAARESFVKLGSDPKADEFVRHRAMVLLLDIAADKQDWTTLASLASDFSTRFPGSDQQPYAQYRLGEALLHTGDPARARQVLTALHDTADPAVRKAEWFPSVRLLLARADLDARNYAGVESVIARFREEDPESPYLYQADEILGRRYKNEARWEDARKAFDRVIDSDTGRRTETAANAQLMIAETYLLQEKYDEAFTAYYKVYANYKFPALQAPALFQAAQCDEKLGRWDGAVKSYELLRSEFPDNPYAKQAEPLLKAARQHRPAGAPDGGAANPAPATPSAMVEPTRRDARKIRKEAKRADPPIVQ